MNSLLKKKIFQDKNINKELIGKLLFKKENGTLNSSLKERKTNELSLMESMEKKFQMNVVIREYQSILNKNKKQKNKFTKSQDNKYQKDLLNNELSYRNFSLKKINIKPKNKESLKPLSSKIIARSKDYRAKFLDFSFISSKDKITHKRNFSSLANNYVKYLKNKKRSTSCNFYKKKQLKFDKIRSKSSLCYYSSDLIFPSKSKKRNLDNSPKEAFRDYDNVIDYKEVLKKLTNEYKFYPANYLEEHKNLEPTKYKFIFDNFNNKFSLFGKYEKIVEDVNDVKTNRKHFVQYHRVKPSMKLIKNIIKKREKNNSCK